MFKKMLCISILFSMSYCKQEAQKGAPNFISQFVKDYAQYFPDETPLSTDNARLSDLHIPSFENLDTIKFFYDKNLGLLNSIKNANDIEPNKKDMQKMENILKNIDAYIVEKYKNPATHNVLYGFQRILNSNFAPIEIRLQILFDKLEKITLFYEAAKMVIKMPDMKQADECIEKHLLTYDFFDKTLPELIQKNNHMTPQYEARLETAKLAVKDYIAYVESLRID